MVAQGTNPARSYADWGLVEGVYSQLAAILSDEQADYIPEVIPGFLAQALGRVSAFYDGAEMQMADDLLAVFSEIEGLRGSPEAQFRRLYHDDRLARFTYYARQPNGRTRPSPFETAIETCRRLRDLSTLQRGLAAASLHAILGGSTSYGRFLNVSGIQRGSASDIDLLIVLSSYEQLADLVPALQRLDGLCHADIDAMKQRSAILPSVRASVDQPCTFSHKIRLWYDTEDPWLGRHETSGSYRLSLHIFNMADFEYLILRDMPILEGPADGFERMLFDYRHEMSWKRLDHQRSFCGTSLFLDRPFREVNGGVITQSRACVIRGDRYYPGMFQNLILPQFEIRWENQVVPIHVQLSGFRWKIVERLRKERQARPYELLRLSLSHTRSFVFAPHIVRSIDGL